MTDTKIDRFGKCPVCKTDWDEGPIVDVFIDQKSRGHWKDYSDEEIKSYVKKCYSPPYKFSKLIVIEDPKSGTISKYICPECECEFT